MKHFALPEGYDGSSTITIADDDFHHLIQVRRKRVGSSFPGRDTKGKPVTLTVIAVERHTCTLAVEYENMSQEGDQPERPHIALFQCLPKARKLDLIIRQATETGVKEIIPVLSNRTVPQKANDGEEKKLARRQRIARQAMQQSGSPIHPTIHDTQQFSSIADTWGRLTSTYPPEDCIGFFFHQTRIGPDRLSAVIGKRLIGICIGPEGGFTDDEITSLLNTGFQPVYISTNVLRTETAALYAIAAVQVMWHRSE